MNGHWDLLQESAPRPGYSVRYWLTHTHQFTETGSRYISRPRATLKNVENENNYPSCQMTETRKSKGLTGYLKTAACQCPTSVITLC
jgi:hypothetical protein